MAAPREGTGRPVALITGASSGIGAAFARLLAADGFDLVLAARRQDLLEAVAGGLDPRAAVAILPVDLSDMAAIADLPERIAAVGPPCHLLVNNAGFGLQGAVADQPPDRLAEMVDVNARASLLLARLLLPGMLARRAGGIINVASVAGFIPGPFMATYYASKAFLLFLSEALWEETRGTGVTVTALCPGPTRTEFQAVAGQRRGGIARGPLLRQAEAEPVARAGLDGWRRGRRVVVPGLANKLIAGLGPLLPRSVVLGAARRAQGR